MTLSGNMDRRIPPWLTGAPLTVIYKKQKGGGIRPIAVEKTLHRLIICVYCSAVKSQLPDVFLPFGQVGVGTSSDLEAAVHSLSSFIDKFGDDPNLCCLKRNMSNSFKNCDRTTFLRRLHRELPDLFKWVQWSYHVQSELRFGIRKLATFTGVQQRDSLGPLLFSLVILELVDEIGPLNDINLKLWYVDD